MTRSATLEVHVINVSQGDSILIINRDLTAVRNALTKAKITVPPDPIDYVPTAVKHDVSLNGTVRKALLIDGGDDEYGGNVVDYMVQLGAIDDKKIFQPNLSLVLSHYHDDHMAGLRSVFKKRIDPGKKGDKVRLEERFRPGSVYQSMTGKKTDPRSQRFAYFQDDVGSASNKAKQPTKRVYVQPGGVDDKNKPITIDLGTGVGNIPVSACIVASGQGVWEPGGKVTKIPSTGKTVDQNDRSVVLMLEYGSFRCMLGGDIAGDGSTDGGNTGKNDGDTGDKKFFSQHADVESKLGPALEKRFPATGAPKAKQPKYPAPGYATVFKADHHGSSSSIDVYFLATLQPLLFIASSGVKARFHRHPTQAVMNRTSATETRKWDRRPVSKKKAGGKVSNSIKQTYITEISKKVKGKNFTVDIGEAKVMGDIIIRPVDETIAAIQAAAAMGQQLEVQVYGIGVLTGLADPQTELRPTEDVDAMSIYPIGPYYHTDTH